jgi:hypothetical protein
MRWLKWIIVGYCIGAVAMGGTLWYNGTKGEQLPPRVFAVLSILWPIPLLLALQDAKSS